MSKITSEEILKIPEEDLKIYRNWREVHNALVEFGNKANMRVFSKVFEDYAEADRLWNLFVGELDRDIFDLLDYLTVKEKDELLVNAVTNKSYLYS
jgi:hypothetical protein